MAFGDLDRHPAGPVEAPAGLLQSAVQIIWSSRHARQIGGPTGQGIRTDPQIAG
jgi:hypothetical protein